MSSSITRRSARLLNAVLQLHKEGYQDLAIFPGMSPSGLHWRCELHTYENLVIENGRVASLGIDCDDEAHHTNNQTGNEYFGWEDCQSATARDLAAKMLERFPALLSRCRRENHEYSGWLVSAVGLAEAGHLPIMISDDGSEGRPDLIGSLANNPPPLQTVRLIGGQRSVFAMPPHLGKEDDWHTAYIRMISAWRSSSIRRLPVFPKPSGDLFEIGAYWEGAIWYIQEVLGITRIELFLDELRSPPASSERWATFLTVWNNEEQMEFLVAFLIRYLISDSTSQKFDSSRLEEYENHLRLFEEAHRISGANSPNPYFGGSNPLHLGMILDEASSSERLI